MPRGGGRRSAPGAVVLAAAATLLAGPAGLAGQAAAAPRFAAFARGEMGAQVAGTRAPPAPLPSIGAPGPVTPGLHLLGDVHPAPRIPTPPAAPDAWLAEDKARHLFASLALTAVAFGGARAVGIEWPDAGIAAAVVAGGAGLAKEFSDRARGRPFSVRDLVWDAAGVGVGVALAERARR